jgi:hypothetical protein
MFDLAILDVAIGLVFLYLLLSLICSAITEMIARLFAMRSSNLKAGIQNLLNDPMDRGYARLLYEQPLLKGLYRQGWADRVLGREGKPSYIPSRYFALALLDIIAGSSKDIDQVRSNVVSIGNTQVRYALLPLIDEAKNDLKAARANIEGWFNEAMERVAGWYKRKTQLIIVGVAVAVSLALNADTFIIANSLWIDPVLRESVVTAAQQATEQPLPNEIEEVKQQLAELQLPLGWHSPPCWWISLASCELAGILTRSLGLLFTAAALSLGAPFWFDLLNKIISLRTSGDPIGTQPAEQSRQPTSNLDNDGRS